MMRKILKKPPPLRDKRKPCPGFFRAGCFFVKVIRQLYLQDFSMEPPGIEFWAKNGFKLVIMLQSNRKF